MSQAAPELIPARTFIIGQPKQVGWTPIGLQAATSIATHLYLRKRALRVKFQSKRNKCRLSVFFWSSNKKLENVSEVIWRKSTLLYLLRASKLISESFCTIRNHHCIPIEIRFCMAGLDFWLDFNRRRDTCLTCIFATQYFIHFSIGFTHETYCVLWYFTIAQWRMSTYVEDGGYNL